MEPGRSDERYHHGDLRRALLEAALELLNEERDVTLRAVARRAGVSHTAPYHHFPDRRALVAAVAEEGHRGLRDELRRAVERRPEDFRLQLLETGVAYVRFAVQNPARFRLMFSAELADRAELPGLAEASAGAYGVLLDTMGRVLGPGVPAEVVERRALAAWATVHGLAMLLLDNQVPGAGEAVEEVERLTRSVLTSGGV